MSIIFSAQKVIKMRFDHKYWTFRYHFQRFQPNTLVDGLVKWLMNFWVPLSKISTKHLLIDGL